MIIGNTLKLEKSAFLKFIFHQKYRKWTFIKKSKMSKSKKNAKQ